MGNRWFNLAIVLVWLSTTTWLFVAKIVPPLRRGEPPNYRSMYSDQAEDSPTYVAWDMSLNGNSLGYAVISLTKKMSGDLTEVESRIHFEHVPLEELSPAWMKALLRTAVLPTDNMRMYVNSRMIIDKLGYLSEFKSTLHVAGLSDAITIRGTIQGTVLRIKVTSGDLEYPFDTYLPSDALVSDELSPQLFLTGLRVGQQWTVPVYSPLRPPTNPVDVLQAQVDRRDFLLWEGQTVPVNVVEYRSDSGSALSSTSRPSAKLWVRDDGAVLKQEVSILGSQLVFLRLSPEKSVQLRQDSIDEEPERPMRWGQHRRWRRQQNSETDSPSTPPIDAEPNPSNNTDPQSN